MIKPLSIYLLLTMLLLWIGGFSQQIEIQDSVRNKSLKKARAYTITAENRIVLEEQLYNEHGKLWQHKIYKNGRTESTLLTFYDKSGRIESQKKVTKEGTIYTTYLYQSGKDLATVSLVKGMMSNIPDSVNTLVFVNYLPQSNEVKQKTVYNRQGFIKNSINEYSNKDGKKIVITTSYTYANAKVLAPSIKTETVTIGERGKTEHSFTEGFPDDKTFNIFYKYSYDDKGRLTNASGHLDRPDSSPIRREETIYDDSAFKKVVQIFVSGTLTEVNTYTMDEYGNYLTLMKENKKNGSKVEIVYNYEEN
jgi:hypothetical protein